MKQLIADEVLLPGCRLPPERKLAGDFRVNRTTLRHTLKLLEGMGVVTQRVGDGTYLNSNASSILVEPIEFLMLMDRISISERYDARMIVEPGLAARAAERATTEHLDEMEAAIQALSKSRNPGQRRDADLRFHEAVFRAAGNRVCHLIFRAVHESIGLEPAAQEVPLRKAVRAHELIYEAIFRRDAAAAHRLMAEHLECCAKALVKTAGTKPKSVSARSRLTRRTRPASMSPAGVANVANGRCRS